LQSPNWDEPQIVTIDWHRTDLQAKLRFACGSDGFLEKARPLLERVGAA
jgi:myo-inositol-1(or 4)-monophosphatase